MAKYTIYMVKLGNPTVTSDSGTGTALAGYFNEVIHVTRALRERFDEGADVQWKTSCPSPAAHELLIYVVSSSVDSIVASLPGFQGRPGGLSDDGLTAWVGSLTASEVYTAGSGRNATMLAKLAFHEAMHNKSHRGAALHAEGGLAASPLTESSQLTANNKRTMANLLLTARSQWTGGCAAYNDPLRGL